MIALSPNPGFALLLGALATFLTPRGARTPVMLAGALGALYLMFAPSFGDQVALARIGMAITPLRLDALSQVFGLGFGLITAILILFSSERNDRLEDVALMALAGGAVSAAFAGDFVTFIAAAQVSAMAGVALAANRRTPQALGASVRMMIWQGLAGLLLVVGAGLTWSSTGEVDFGQMDAGTPGGVLFLLALLILLGAPLAHVWFKDAAAAATPTGGAALAAFPLALALYALLRAFPGEPILLPIGAVLALLPLPFAASAQDMRRALAYGALSQAGVAAMGVGAATPLALAGAAAFAFACVFHNALAFMAAGLAYERANGVVGGLARSMPLTALMAIAAGLSAIGMPAFAGFTGSGVISAALGQEGRAVYWFAAIAASAGAALHMGLRAPFEIFFGRDRGARPADAPFAPLLAMGLAAFFVLAIGANPGWLYALLPEGINFRAFENGAALTQAQIIVFALLTFGLVKRFGLYPTVKAGDIPDIDWLYRRPFPAGARAVIDVAAGLNRDAQRIADGVRNKSRAWLSALPRADNPSMGLKAQGGLLLATAVFLLAVFYAARG